MKNVWYIARLSWIVAAVCNLNIKLEDSTGGSNRVSYHIPLQLVMLKQYLNYVVW